MIYLFLGAVLKKLLSKRKTERKNARVLSRTWGKKRKKERWGDEEKKGRGLI